MKQDRQLVRIYENFESQNVVITLMFVNFKLLLKCHSLTYLLFSLLCFVSSCFCFYWPEIQILLYGFTVTWENGIILLYWNIKYKEVKRQKQKSKSLPKIIWVLAEGNPRKDLCNGDDVCRYSYVKGHSMSA